MKGHSSEIVRSFGACLVVVAVAIGLLPATTAHMQGDSPLPTPPPPATQEPTVVPPPLPPAPTTAPRTNLSARAPRIVTQRIQENDPAAPYLIDVRYPQVAGSPDAWLGFNTYAEGQAQDLVAQFKNDVTTAGTVTATDLPTNTLYATFEVFRATRDFLSIRWTISTYSAGAAHPNTFSRVINYDARTDKDLSLGDLFKPSADYLKTLSDYCTRVLQRRNRLDFPKGAEPKPENYANWNIGRFNLVISFDPYVVAPYAAGRQECQVPLRTLRTVLAEPRRW